MPGTRTTEGLSASTVLGLVLIVGFATTTGHAAPPEGRVALVIGNAAKNAFDTAVSQNTTAAFQAVIEHFPRFYAALARQKVEEFEAARAAAQFNSRTGSAGCSDGIGRLHHRPRPLRAFCASIFPCFAASRYQRTASPSLYMTPSMY